VTLKKPAVGTTGGTTQVGSLSVNNSHTSGGNNNSWAKSHADEPQPQGYGDEGASQPMDQATMNVVPSDPSTFTKTITAVCDTSFVATVSEIDVIAPTKVKAKAKLEVAWSGG
jgi:hypothetical protein